MSHECNCHEALEHYRSEVRQLRASHRRMCAGLAIVSCLLLVGWAAQSKPDIPDRIQAHSFELLDSKGGISSLWSVNEDDEHRIGSASLIFNSDLGMAALITAGDGNPRLHMNGGGNYVAEGRLGHVLLGCNAKQGPFLELWSQVADSAASQGGKTSIRTPWADNPKCIEVVKGEATAWVAPPEK